MKSHGEPDDELNEIQWNQQVVILWSTAPHVLQRFLHAGCASGCMLPRGQFSSFMHFTALTILMETKIRNSIPLSHFSPSTLGLAQGYRFIRRFVHRIIALQL